MFKIGALVLERNGIHHDLLQVAFSVYLVNAVAGTVNVCHNNLPSDFFLLSVFAKIKKICGQAVKYGLPALYKQPPGLELRGSPRWIGGTVL